MRLTLSQTLIVLGGVMAMAVVASAGQFLTGIPAYLIGAALAAPAVVVVKRLKA